MDYLLAAGFVLTAFGALIADNRRAPLILIPSNLFFLVLIIGLLAGPAMALTAFIFALLPTGLLLRRLAVVADPGAGPGLHHGWKSPAGLTGFLFILVAGVPAFHLLLTGYQGDGGGGAGSGELLPLVLPLAGLLLLPVACRARPPEDRKD